MSNTKQKTDASIFCAYDDLVPIHKLVPNSRNPNTHPDEQIRLLAKMMEHQGWRCPITVSTRSGLIVRGHGRLQAAKLLGLTTAPVDYQDYECDADEWADLIADNRIAELAEMDRSVLKDLLEELDVGVMDMELTGWGEDELKELMSEFHVPDLEPTIGTRTIEPGDITKAAQRLEERFNKSSDQVAFSCPHCGEAFYVNRADIP